MCSIKEHYANNNKGVGCVRHVRMVLSGLLIQIFGAVVFLIITFLPLFLKLCLKFKRAKCGVLVCPSKSPKPKDIMSTIIYDEEKQKLFQLFEMLKPESGSIFSLLLLEKILK